MERNALRCLKWGLVFDFLDFSIGSLELFPDFVGMLLFYASIQAHESQTQGEKQVKPLFLLLAADYFVHWIWEFENGVEMLLTTVIYIYAIYVLFGEVAQRIRTQQPECAGRLDVIRTGMMLLQVFGFLSSAYGNNVLNVAVIFAAVALAASCIVVICGIVPEEAGE
mgnify:CR=1 FL=1